MEPCLIHPHVRSCGVFVDDTPLTYGAELDVVVDPPPGPGALLWVRVVHRVTAGGAEGYIDSIGGVPPGDLGHVDRVERLADGAGATPERLVARLFLVRDIGADVVTILGGVTYGWQVEELPGRGPAPGTAGGWLRGQASRAAFGQVGDCWALGPERSGPPR